MTTALFTGGGEGAPEEYIDLILCRDIYHCTPEELDRQDYGTVLLHYEMHMAEKKVKHQKEEAAAKKGRK